MPPVFPTWFLFLLGSLFVNITFELGAAVIGLLHQLTVVLQNLGEWIPCGTSVCAYDPVLFSIKTSAAVLAAVKPPRVESTDFTLEETHSLDERVWWVLEDVCFFVANLICVSDIEG